MANVLVVFKRKMKMDSIEFSDVNKIHTEYDYIELLDELERAIAIIPKENILYLQKIVTK